MYKSWKKEANNKFSKVIEVAGFNFQDVPFFIKRKQKQTKKDTKLKIQDVKNLILVPISSLF